MKKCLILVFVLMLSLAGTASADYIGWDNDSGDQLWETAANWNEGGEDGYGDDCPLPVRMSRSQEVLVFSQTMFTSILILVLMRSARSCLLTGTLCMELSTEGLRKTTTKRLVALPL